MVDILDIGSGNIQSIKYWIEKSRVSTRIVSNVSDLRSNLLVLPGVGSAGSYMKRLKAGHFDQAIYEHVDRGGRLIGICLGFQIMANFTEEDGGVEGLGLVDANVEKLPLGSHNSWESFYLRKTELNGQSFNSTHHLTRKKIIDGRVFYNHEYGFVNNESNVYSNQVSEELNRYSGMLIKDNIIGIQFHPEKSQYTGLELVSMIL